MRPASLPHASRIRPLAFVVALTIASSGASAAPFATQPVSAGDPSTSTVSTLSTSTTTTPTLPLPEGAKTRPYTATGPWNTRIPANPVLDPKSATWIAGVGPLTSNTASYTYPVYTVHGKTTPKVVYTATGTAAVISADGKTRTSPSNKQISIPMPTAAVASAGTDGQIIVIDLDTGDEYDLWQVDTATRTVKNMTKFNAGFLSPGTTSVVYPSRGAGIVYYGGLIRPWEILQGRIDHALAFAYNKVSPSFRYPATKSDGKYSGLPEGARIQLDPSFNVNSLSNPTARIIARALQEYGAYVIDYAGNGGKIYAEDAVTARWGTSGIPSLVTNTISQIPASKLRVLRQWDGK